MPESSHLIAFAAATGLHRARAFYEQVLGLPVAGHDAIWTAPGGDKVAWFADPDGNVLSLTQFA